MLHSAQHILQEIKHPPLIQFLQAENYWITKIFNLPRTL